MERFSVAFLEDEVSRVLQNKKTELLTIESRDMDAHLREESKYRVLGEILTLENIVQEIWGEQAQSKYGIKEFIKQKALSFGYDTSLGSSQVKRMGTEENYRYGRYSGYQIIYNFIK